MNNALITHRLLLILCSAALAGGLPGPLVGAPIAGDALIIGKKRPAPKKPKETGKTRKLDVCSRICKISLC